MGTDERLVLAVDSGGTKCDAVLAREDGTLLAWAHVRRPDQPVGQNAFGAGRSFDTIIQAVKQVLGDRTCRELHVAGLSRKYYYVWDVFERSAVVVKVYRCYESDPAFALSGHDYGIAVVAGTGANVQARTPDGRFDHLDGLGPLLGDYGGAFNIGLQAVRAVGKFEWHDRYKTSLTEPVFRTLGLRDDPPHTYQLLYFMVRQHDRSVVASLARVVDEEARRGDVTAQRILREAAWGLAETVGVMAERTGMCHDPYPVIGYGSVALRSDIFWDAFTARLRAYRPNLRPMRMPQPPVVGGAYIPLRRLNAVNQDTLMHNLFASADALRPGK